MASQTEASRPKRCRDDSFRHLCRVVCHCNACEEQSDGMTMLERAVSQTVCRRTSRHHIKKHGRSPRSLRDHQMVDDIDGYRPLRFPGMVLCRCTHCCEGRRRHMAVRPVTMETCMEHLHKYGSAAVKIRYLPLQCDVDADDAIPGESDETGTPESDIPIPCPSVSMDKLPFDPPSPLAADQQPLWGQITRLWRADFNEGDLLLRLPGSDGARKLSLPTRMTQSLPHELVEEMQTWLGKMLLAKVRFSLSEQCVAFLCSIWKDSNWISEDVREAIPEDLGQLLSAMAACGTRIPTIFIYDYCDSCGQVFRCQSAPSDVLRCPDCGDEIHDALRKSTTFQALEDVLYDSGNGVHWVISDGICQCQSSSKQLQQQTSFLYLHFTASHFQVNGYSDETTQTAFLLRSKTVRRR